MALDWDAMEKRWQREWYEKRHFEADPNPNRPKCFVTFPFPYMSGPLHVGSGFTATRIDIYARYKRMRGFNVLFPWAWHWTGKTVAGAAERIKMGDEDVIRPIRDVDRVPDEHLRKFIDPAYMARYYTDVNRESVKRLGLSIDWRREFHTSSLDPGFSQFVVWQYLRLREKGYVIKGTHPVVWCPKDESPTGDADRLEGEGIRPEEFILIKFRMGDLVLACATFRPETIYGVTNLWVNPEGDYVEAYVNNERWVVGRTAAEKLQNQLRKVRVVGTIPGSSLVGKRCTEPIHGRELLLLPASFVKTENATGLVYSVPGHAPYDWLALRDLQKNPSTLEKFAINPSELSRILPISIITVEGFGELPAVELVDKMRITDQNDPLAEEATREIYKAEFHGGILKDACGEYAKQKVSEVKKSLIEDFKKKGIADTMYELPERVTCRCKTECLVKILEDQWFLKYSDQGWKNLGREAIDSIIFYPEEARSWFQAVIDWLQDWPCARKTGLGTPLPWSHDWLVETLSDSTVYMAYYAISKYVNSALVKPEQLTPEIFDYIFYGTGEPESLMKSNGLNVETLEAIRREFLYWYPVDLRNSGKDLVGNHLSFFILHHVALFEPKLWPLAIGVNGWMLAEGAPMHKSKGNFIPLWKACNDFGADVVRCTALLAAEGMDDPDWRSENAKDIRGKLEAILNLVDEKAKTQDQASNHHLENWLITRIDSKAKLVSEAIEKLKTRTALVTALFDIWNDLRWYERRVTKLNAATVKEYLSAWVRILSPFTPHLSDEAWRRINGEGFASTSPWPKFDESKIDETSLELEDLVKKTLEDAQEIISTLRFTPRKVHLYISAPWKWRIYLEATQRAKSEPETLDKLTREPLPTIFQAPKESYKFASKMIQRIKTASQEKRERSMRLTEAKEFEVLSGAKQFLERELKVDVTVHMEDEANLYDPKGRAKLAEPLRSAIYVE